jgi:hypothetical protein
MPHKKKSIKTRASQWFEQDLEKWKKYHFISEVL